MNLTSRTSIGWMLLLSFGFGGCKKDSAPKDLAPLFKNTIWTGEFNYTAGTSQPVSMEFKEGGLLSWYELAGEAAGSWQIDSGRISVTLPNRNGFKAEVSGDNKLTNVSVVPGSSIAAITAALNTSTDLALDETIWTAPNVQLHFKGGNKVDMALGPAGGTVYPDIPYVYKAKTIRYAVVSGDYNWFFVRSSATAFKGVNQFSPDATLYPFNLSKN